MSAPHLSEDTAWSAIVAEAASWIALLHGPDRTPAAERGLKRWLSENPLHAQAFELATETWNDARASVKRGAKVKVLVPGESERPAKNSWRPVWAAAAAVAAMAIGALLTWSINHERGTVTAVGERRILALEDGTQISLNTATRIVVEYDKQQRRVRLESGEAIFEVAKRPDWPFVVAVGDRRITALGTAFLVRRDERRTAITLIEGKVVVSTSSGNPASAQHETASSPTILTPGERITYLEEKRTPQMDRPELAKLTAWQSGRVNMDALTLAEAAVEMNRYSPVQIEVHGSAAELRLSGMFRIGDSRNFANAVARTYGLSMEEDGRRIVISDAALTD